MELQSSKSTCLLCQSQYSGKGMSRHLKFCLKKELGKREIEHGKSLVHLHITPVYSADYFLHLLVKETTILKDLDQYLRSIWLECCGHMSAFTDRAFGRNISMGTSINHAFVNRTTLKYQYDFGSTTELDIKLAGHYPSTPEISQKINLLARNAPLSLLCDNCGKKQAVFICDECQWDDEGLLCESCARVHKCGEDRLMNFPNSPRAGVCGYTGDDNDESFVKTIFIEGKKTQKNKKEPGNVIQLKDRKRKVSKEDSNVLNPETGRVSIIKKMIHAFCRQHLNEELAGYACNLTDTLSAKINISRGKIEIWSAAIVYAIARLNFLFDPYQEIHITSKIICDFFQTKQSTVSSKATLIADACDLGFDAERYCSSEIADIFTLFETPEGFVFPKNMLPDVFADYQDDYEALLNPEFLQKIVNNPAILNTLQPEFQNLLEHILSEISSISDDMEENPQDITDVAPKVLQSRKDAEKERKAQRQEKITEQEKEIIDDGQLSIFD